MSQIDENLVNQIIAKLKDELHDASDNNPNFASYHEGFAVLYEEVDELWDEVKKSKRERSKNKTELLHESVQVGAMIIRFIHDLLDFRNDEAERVNRSQGSDKYVCYRCSIPILRGVFYVYDFEPRFYCHSCFEINHPDVEVVD